MGVAPEESIECKQGIHPGFETQGRRFQSSKRWQPEAQCF